MHKTTHTKKRVSISLSANDITSMMVELGHLSESQGRESVKFHVPGGGDWSHMDIDIDKENPIVVSYELNETEEQ